jgi:hypothetical protein
LPTLNILVLESFHLALEYYTRNCQRPYKDGGMGENSYETALAGRHSKKHTGRKKNKESDCDPHFKFLREVKNVGF